MTNIPKSSTQQVIPFLALPPLSIKDSQRQFQTKFNSPLLLINRDDSPSSQRFTDSLSFSPSNSRRPHEDRSDGPHIDVILRALPILEILPLGRRIAQVGDDVANALAHSPSLLLLLLRCRRGVFGVGADGGGVRYGGGGRSTVGAHRGACHCENKSMNAWCVLVFVQSRLGE